MSSVSASVCASAPRTDPTSATLVAAPVLPALVLLRGHTARVDLRALLGRVDLRCAVRIRRDVTDDVGAAATLVEVRRELLRDRPGWERGRRSEEAEVLDIHPSGADRLVEEVLAVPVPELG